MFQMSDQPALAYAYAELTKSVATRPAAKQAWPSQHKSPTEKDLRRATRSNTQNVLYTTRDAARHAHLVGVVLETHHPETKHEVLALFVKPPFRITVF